MAAGAGCLGLGLRAEKALAELGEDVSRRPGITFSGAAPWRERHTSLMGQQLASIPFLLQILEKSEALVGVAEAGRGKS